MYIEKPTIHGVRSPVTNREVVWQEREGYRACSYCGSMHPEDFIKHMTSDDPRIAAYAEGSFLGSPNRLLEVADWKYGYPHKIYVNGIPHPQWGEQIESGGRYWVEDGMPMEEKHYSTATYMTGKFYTEHLHEMLGQSEFYVISDIIRKKTGVRFDIDEKGLHYQWDKEVTVE